MPRTPWITFALAISLTGGVFAADPPPQPKPERPTAFLDPATAGPEFKVQGEYEGMAGGKKVGCQVIALGDGTFRAVFEEGGLPGAGWDGKSRVEVNGKTEGDAARFNDAGYTASIEGEKLIGKTGAGESIELTKVFRKSPAEGAKPPPGAMILFDGSNTDAFEKGKIDSRGLLGIGVTTKQHFSDFTLHLEFIEPFKPKGRGQDRGNSGVYIQRHYEIQILDSFGLTPKPNDCASVYTKIPPLLNMCFPPLSWQTYDIDFSAARYDEKGKKTSPAYVTVKQNGVVVQDHTELPDHTGAGKPEDPKEQVQSGPIYLQDHNNPVFFRNIWIIDKK